MEKPKMKQLFALVLAGSALMSGQDAQAATAPVAAQRAALDAALAATDPSLAPTPVRDDADEGTWVSSNGGGSGSDDHNGDDSDSDSADCTAEDDPSCTLGGAGNAAPAGTVSPPQNGLFTKGTAPQATSN
jgi:hypothetical protein